MKQGIVHREAAGNALMHTLDREHVGASAVKALAGMRSELWSRLREAILGWDVPAVHASVFGSAARGDGTTTSDIDLVIVRPGDVASEDPRWRDQLDALASLVRTWTGNPASIVKQGESEMHALARRARLPKVIAELRRDAIDLAGEPVRTLLQPAR